MGYHFSISPQARMGSRGGGVGLGVGLEEGEVDGLAVGCIECINVWYK